jgi:arylformamidase
MIRDISIVTSPATVVYEGDPRPWLYRYADVAPGNDDTYACSVLALGTHVGTHVDPPRHFFADGATVDRLDPAALCGRARVVDLTADGLALDEHVLRRLDLAGVERLLLKTANGGLAGRPFTPDYAHLTPDGARYLAGLAPLALVGIDYVSIERFPAPGCPVHRTLLGRARPVLVLEGLDLREVSPGDYELLCLPLKLEGGDGGPARAVLRDLP